MMAIDEDFIMREVNRVVSLVREHERTPDSKKGIPPEYYPGYQRLVEQYEDVRIHTVKGVFPEKLFKEKSPNMQDEEFSYVRKNFKQTTLPVSIDYFNSIKRSFADGNWSINYNNQDDFRDYLDSDFPEYTNIETFIKQVLPVLKTQDPNGVLAIRPSALPIDEQGNLKDNEEISPGIFYFSVAQKLAFKEREWYLLLSNKKSTVKEYGKDKDVGLVFEFYDSTAVWMISQIGKKSDWDFEMKKYYEYNLEAVPVRELMGIPVVENGSKYYQSPFLYATDILDLILINSSQLQVSINSCVFPVRVMIGNECDFKDGESNPCVDGKIFSNDGEEKVCPSCNGSGMKARISPLGTILLRPKSSTLPDGESSADAAFKFHSPEVTTLDFLIKKIDIDETKARGILHIHNSNTDSKGADAETATGKYIDQKTLYSFIKPISSEMFDLFRWAVDTIGVMRLGDKYEEVNITEPITFEFLTEQDYINQIKDAMDAGMPPMIVTPLIYKFIDTFFYNQDETAMAFETLVKADRLLTMTREEIALGLSRGSIARWEEYLHYSGFFLITRLMEEGGFAALSLEDKIVRLHDSAKVKAEEITASNISPVEELSQFSGLE